MEIRPNDERAKAAEIMIWVVLGTYLVGFVSNILEYRLLKVMEGGGYFTMDEASGNDRRQLTIAVLIFLAFVVSTITYIRWFRRAYFNLHQRTGSLSMAEGWAAGAWFVPILNLFRPYQIMKEMYLKTSEMLLDKGVQPNPKMSNIGIWWTLWIVVNVFGRFSNRYSIAAENLSDHITSNVLSMIGNLSFIPLSIYAVTVIRNYDRMERMLPAPDRIGQAEDHAGAR